MRYRTLGRSEMSVSEIALGTWLTLGSSVGRRSTAAIVHRAFDLGINLFDTADVYSEGECEQALGAALRELPRERVLVATKAFFPMADRPEARGLSRMHLLASVQGSLRRLGTDYIDLHQCHRYDPDTPLEETVGAYGDLIQQGLVRHWGVSLWTPEQIEAACRIAADSGAPAPISNQSQYSILRRDIERDVVPRCERAGVGQLVFSPLAQGVLSGKYRGGRRPENTRAADPQRRVFLEEHLGRDSLERVDALLPLAAEHGLTMPQLALAWCLRRPGVAAAIVGVTSLAQLEDNAAASGISLSREALRRIDELFDTRPAG